MRIKTKSRLVPFLFLGAFLYVYHDETAERPNETTTKVEIKGQDTYYVLEEKRMAHLGGIDGDYFLISTSLPDGMLFKIKTENVETGEVEEERAFSEDGRIYPEKLNDVLGPGEYKITVRTEHARLQKKEVRDETGKNLSNYEGVIKHIDEQGNAYVEKEFKYTSFRNKEVSEWWRKT